MFWHKSPRELQTAYLALKILSPSQINQLFHIQLQIDNQAAISYIKSLKTSFPIKSGSVELVPIKTDPYLCKVYPRYLQQTCRSYVKKVKANCRMEVEPYSVPKDCCSLQDATDRFVCDKSQHSAQKCCIMDTRLAQNADIDAFSVQWSDPLSYAFCPFSLIIRCVQRIKNQKGKILLVTPVWRSRPW